MSNFLKRDKFTKTPIYCLLPEARSIVDLSRYAASFYARFEKAKEMEEEGNDLIYSKQETDMLRQVLDWINLNKQGAGE